jgi:tetratricopeptide (TPR) repeat protein
MRADLGQLAEARKAWERAREMDPDALEPKLGLAELALAEKNPDEAIALVEGVLEANPSEATAGRLLAQAYLLRGETEQAEQQLRAVLRKNPEGADAANDLAWLLANEGRELDLALQLAASASRLAPEAQILDTLGWVQYQRGEIDTAIATYEGLIEIWPRFPTARYHLGLALVRKGDLDRAGEMFEAALSAGDFPEADAARSELAALQSRREP